MRTSAGWISVGRLQSSQESAIFQSTDGVSWGSTPVFTFTNGSRVSLWQALQNDPQEAVVLASVQSRIDGNWLDIFRSEDGGRTFKPLGILGAAAARVSRTAILGSVECLGVHSLPGIAYHTVCRH